MGHFAPVSGDHVGGGAQAGGAAELGHHLAARENAFGAAGVFGVSEFFVAVAAQTDGVLQKPAAVRVQRDAGIGKALGQRHDGFDFIFAAQHAALELEVLEAVACVSGLGQAHDGFRVHGGLVAQALPVVAGCGPALVGQVGLLAVCHIKKIAEHGHRVALLAFAQQGCHRHAQKLPEQVQQGAFNSCDGMDGHAHVKGLVAATAAVAIGEAGAQAVEYLVPVAQQLAFDERTGVFQGVANFFAAWHFTHPGTARTVGEDQ